MNGRAVLWMLSAVGVLGLGIASYVLGRSLLPAAATMQSKLGTAAPVFFTWGMISVVIICAVVLAGFFVATGLEEGRRSS